MFFPAADTIAFAEGGAEAMRLNSSGNVGIGTTNPGDKLTVIGAGQFNVNENGTSTPLKLSNDNTTGTVVAKLAFQNQGSIKASINAAVYNNDFLAFNTGSDTERMRIDSSGNLNVGQSSGPNGGSRLGISNDCGVQAMQIWTNTAGGSATQNIVLLYRGSTLTGSIQNTASSTAYNTSSDYRLKENVAPMVGALNKIALLKPCTYTWKINGTQGQGFIAHELQEIVPECVSGEKDAVDKDGKIMPQGIDTSFLVATLTAAIQELKAELDNVKTELATLKGAPQ
jgi:hypothetical protein